MDKLIVISILLLCLCVFFIFYRIRRHDTDLHTLKQNMKHQVQDEDVIQIIKQYLQHPNSQAFLKHIITPILPVHSLTPELPRMTEVPGPAIMSLLNPFMNMRHFTGSHNNNNIIIEEEDPDEEVLAVDNHVDSTKNHVEPIEVVKPIRSCKACRSKIC